VARVLIVWMVEAWSLVVPAVRAAVRPRRPARTG
jgi:hypothetical protein